MRGAVLVLALAACGPLTPPVVDAGTGGGAATGGGASTGGGSATGGGGGSATGGGTATGGGAATGGGTATGGGPGTWEFSSMGLSPAPTSSGSILGFAETDAGLFAVSTSGYVYRSTGGAFLQLFRLISYVRDFEGSPSGRMFALGSGELWRCEGECADAGSWTSTTVLGASASLRSVCVIDDAHVLVVGNLGGGSDAVSWKWDGAQLAAGSSSLGGTYAQDCWKGASGNLFIAAQNAVLEYSPDTEGVTPHATPSMLNWRGGGSSPGHEWLTGSGPTIADGASGWATAFTASSGSITAVIGVSDSLAFAFGGGFTSEGQAGYRWDGGAWAPMNPDLPVINTTSSAFRTSGGTIYVGGDDSNNLPCIIRGVRR